MNTRSQRPPENRRTSSLVDMIALTQGSIRRLGVDEMPSWIVDFGVPAGWHVGQLAGDRRSSLRLTACGIQPDGGFDGCETVAAFGFTGRLPEGLVLKHADRGLRELEAADIETVVLDVSPVAGAVGVRCQGTSQRAGYGSGRSTTTS